MAEADFTLGVDFDVPGVEESARKVVQKAEDELNNLGKGVRQSTILRPFKAIFDAFAKMTKSVEDTNKVQAKGAELDKKRVEYAKDVLKQHREAHALKRAEAIMEAGGPGTEKIGPYGGTRGRQRGITKDQIPGLLADALQVAGNVWFGGGSSQSIVHGLGGISKIGMQIGGANPGWGQMVDVVTGLAVQALDTHDRKMEAGLKGYQVGGMKGTKNVFNPSFGFTYDQFAAMQYQFARRGGTPDRSTLGLLAQMETHFGMGSETSRLLTTARRSGVNRAGDGEYTQDAYILSSAVALALSEKLDRGRLPEALEELTSVMERNALASVNVQDTINRLAFISRMGQQFQGDTAGKREMEKVMQDLAQGTTPMSSLNALFATGYGQGGVSWGTAQVRKSQGLGAGLSTNALLAQNFDRYRQQWMTANDAQRDWLASTIGPNLGMTPYQARLMMDEYFGTGASGIAGIKGVDPMAGAQFLGTQTVPEKLIKPRVDKAVSEQIKGDVGGWLDEGLGGMASLFSGERSFGQGQSEFTGDPRRTLAPYDQGSFSSRKADFSSDSTSDEFMSKYVKRKTGKFGAQRDSGAHPGVDLEFAPGTTVYAVEGGIVVQKSDSFKVHGKETPNTGAIVVIKGMYTGDVYRYLHLEPGSVKVRRGQVVDTGAEIGRTRAKHWNKTPSHLHFEVLRNGKQVNPKNWSNMETLINPVMQRGGATAPPTDSPVSSPSQVDPGTPAGAAGASAAAPVVKVDVVIQDQTSNGVSVKQSVKDYATQANAPAPGTAPATSDKP